jgi:hypothetical protein
MKRLLMLPVLLLAAAAISGDDDEDKFGYDFPITPYTQVAIQISSDGIGGLESKAIRVPEEPNKFASLCFEVADHALLQCLYINHGSNKVDIVSVLPEKTKL